MGLLTIISLEMRARCGISIGLQKYYCTMTFGIQTDKYTDQIWYYQHILYSDLLVFPLLCEDPRIRLQPQLCTGDLRDSVTKIEKHTGILTSESESENCNNVGPV